MICGNEKKYDKIKQWIVDRFNCNESKISFKSLIFITGNSGIGKTYHIKEICHDLNLHVVYLSTENCASSNELTDLIVKNTSSSMIQLLTNDDRKKIIIIDDFESMMALDRTINTALYNLLNNGKLKNIPIICISSSDIIKKIGMIKKKCEIIELEEPTEKDIFNLLISLYPEHSQEALKNIANISQGNITQCLGQIDDNGIKKYDEIDTNLNVNMLYKGGNNELLRKIMMNEPLMISLKFHENLINELKNRKSTIKQRNEYYKFFMYNFLSYDMLMSKNHADNGIEIFISATSQLRNMYYIQKKSANIENFTKILTYLSLQKKYIKKSYSSCFPLYQISNYHINMIRRNYIFFK